MSLHSKNKGACGLFCPLLNCIIAFGWALQSADICSKITNSHSLVSSQMFESDLLIHRSRNVLKRNSGRRIKISNSQRIYHLNVLNLQRGTLKQTHHSSDQSSNQLLTLFLHVRMVHVMRMRSTGHTLCQQSAADASFNLGKAFEILLDRTGACEFALPSAAVWPIWAFHLDLKRENASVKTQFLVPLKAPFF